MQEHWIAKQVVVVDESSKDDRMIFCCYGCAISSERAVMPANFVRGDHYSIVVAMGVEGYIAMCVVLGSVDGDKFFDFIVNDVICGHVIWGSYSVYHILQLPKMHRYSQD
jgi:hypothetical protein